MIHVLAVLVAMAAALALGILIGGALRACFGLPDAVVVVHEDEWTPEEEDRLYGGSD